MLDMAASAGPLDVDKLQAKAHVSQYEDRAGNVGHYSLWKRDWNMI